MISMTWALASIFFFSLSILLFFLHFQKWQKTRTLSPEERARLDQEERDENAVW